MWQNCEKHNVRRLYLFIGEQGWSSVKEVHFREWWTAPFIQKGQKCPYREMALIMSILEMGGGKRLRARSNVQSVFPRTSKLRISPQGPCQSSSTKPAAEDVKINDFFFQPYFLQTHKHITHIHKAYLSSWDAEESKACSSAQRDGSTPFSIPLVRPPVTNPTATHAPHQAWDGWCQPLPPWAYSNSHWPTKTQNAATIPNPLGASLGAHRPPAC